MNPIEYLKPSQIRVDPGNVYTHADGDIARLVHSIQEHSFLSPLVVDAASKQGLNGDASYELVGGEARLEAAKICQLAEIPCTIATFTDKKQRDMAAVALNSSYGAWDDTKLATLLQDLQSQGADLDDTGLKPHELDELLASINPAAALTDPDDVPEPPAKPITRPGDLWLFGKHRLLCGDSTQPEQRARLMPETVDLIVTDPPYCSGGFQEAGRSAGSIGSDAKIKKSIANDRLSTRGYMALMKAAIGASDVPTAYIFTDWRMWVNLFDVVESSGFGARSMIVWDKGSPGMGMGWRSQHELVMFASKASKLDWDHHQAQGNVITSKRTGNPLHPTQKPVDVIEQLLNVSRFAETIYDPFGGSGTTLMAAHTQGKTAYVMEMDPGFCDVICHRFQEHTGIEPVREANGKPHDFTKLSAA